MMKTGVILCVLAVTFQFASCIPALPRDYEEGPERMLPSIVGRPSAQEGPERMPPIVGRPSAQEGPERMPPIVGRPSAQEGPERMPQIVGRPGAQAPDRMIGKPSEMMQEPFTNMTIDQLIMMAYGGSANDMRPENLEDENKRLAELDMVLTKNQSLAMYGSRAGHGAHQKPVARHVRQPDVTV